MTQAENLGSVARYWLAAGLAASLLLAAVTTEPTGPATSVALAAPTVAHEEEHARPASRRVEWRLSRRATLPPVAPHYSATRVPQYPLKDASLDNPHSWPSKAHTDLGACVLNIQEGETDSIVNGVAVDEKDTEFIVGLSYDCPPPGGRVVGPAYTWDPGGWVAIRSWGGFHDGRYVWREWSYYKSGKLFGYTHQVWTRRTTGPSAALQEYFGRDGKLLGYSLIQPVTARTSRHTTRWMGKTVTDAAFHKAVAELSSRRGESQ